MADLGHLAFAVLVAEPAWVIAAMFVASFARPLLERRVPEVLQSRGKTLDRPGAAEGGEAVSGDGSGHAGDITDHGGGPLTGSLGRRRAMSVVPARAVLVAAVAVARIWLGAFMATASESRSVAARLVAAEGAW